jgi:glycosyltransferase involved in cell wall biosynthesis
VLYINKYNFRFSGTEAYLLDLMQLMQAHGHKTALFCMADARGEPSPYDHYSLPPVDFKDPQHGLGKRVRLAAHAIYSREARKRLERLIRDFRPDVAHVRNIYHHLSPSVLWELKKQGVPVVYHLNDFKLLCPSYNLVSQGRACEQCRGGRFWHVLTEGCYPGWGAAAVLATEAYAHKWLRTYQRCVDRFLAPSQFVCDKLVENGWDRSKIEVLHHFQVPVRQEAAAEAENAPILYFGRLSAEKGIDDLLRAMRQVPRIPLLIAGDGPEQERLRDRARELGLQNVMFLGHVHGEALQKLIAGSRFTVLPSLAYETLGKTILESYAAARPVIATDLGSRRELVVEGETGLLYPPGDVDRLAGAISFLYERPSLCRSMGEAGQRRLRERHQPEMHYEALLGLYRQLATSSAQRPATAPARKLRVAFVGGRGVVGKYSGIEAYYEEVGSRLSAKQHEITVYCRNYFTPAAAAHHGMRLVRLPTLRTKHLETAVHTLLSTLHACCTGHDIVHFHALGPALFAFLPRLFGKKTVVTVQGLDWQRKKWGRVAATLLRLGEKAAVSLPHQTMVVSRTLQQHYRQRYGAETVYIPNGTVLRKRRTGEHLEVWGLEPGNYALFLGRFSPEKNCHLLLRAYEQLDTPVKLVLAGGSSYSDAYASELRRHQSEKIRILDWVSGEALEELLTNAMLFVLPSDLEGLSLALLDAMGAGVCVLTSDVPENRELVEGAGFTFRRGDPRDLERMLQLLLNDFDLRELAARAARARIAESYLWPQITEQIERAYQQVMGWPSQPHTVLTMQAEPPRAPEDLRATS